MKERRYNSWIVVSPARDVPGEWVAHCLDVDVLSQGTSFPDAIRMVTEATAMVIIDDLEHDRDPLDRRAPEEFFDEVYRIVETGERVDITRGEFQKCTYVFQVEIVANKIAAPIKASSRVESAPAMKVAFAEAC